MLRMGFKAVLPNLPVAAVCAKDGSPAIIWSRTPEADPVAIAYVTSLANSLVPYSKRDKVATTLGLFSLKLMVRPRKSGDDPASDFRFPSIISRQSLQLATARVAGSKRSPGSTARCLRNGRRTGFANICKQAKL